MDLDEVVDFAVRKSGIDREHIEQIGVELSDHSMWDTSSISTKYVMDIKSSQRDDTILDTNILELSDSSIENNFDNLVKSVNEKVEINDSSVRIEQPRFTIDLSENEPEIRSFRSVSMENSELTDDVKILIEKAVDKLKEVDSSVDIESFIKLSILYSDFKRCEVSSVRTEISTKSPHKYYDVDSLDEYIEKSNKSNHLDNGYYSVSFIFEFFDDDTDYSDFIELAEDIMDKRLNSLISVSGNYNLEAEGISYTENNNEVTRFYLEQKIS